MRRVAALLVCVLAVTACESTDDGPPVGRVVSSGFGIVVGEDALSSRVAREVLARGGTAADAAVAYFFMAAVNYPSRASLASGGVCLTYEEGENRARVLDFRNGPASRPENGVSVPGAVRGMSALQAVSGTLAWQDLLVPAERAARFGLPVSRTLARDLERASATFLEDANTQRIFGAAEGGTLRQGDDLIQFELSEILSGIRTRGASDFYVGRTATSLLEAARTFGLAITPDELRSYRVSWSEPRTFGLDRGLMSSKLAIHVPGAGFDAGESAIAALMMLRHGESLSNGASADHLVAEVALRTAVARTMRQAGESGAVSGEALMAGYGSGSATSLAELPRTPTPLDETPFSSGVVATDRRGNAVACVFTMNGLFGSGRVLPGTGILLSSPSGDGMSLLPVMAVNETLRSVVFAGAGTGGSASGTVMASILSDVVDDDSILAEAVRRARVHHPGIPHVVLAEAALGSEAVEALEERGHVVETVAELVRITAVHCSGGLRNAPESCVAVTDPRIP